MKRKRGVPTRQEVQAQGSIELHFDIPLEPTDKTLPAPDGQLHLNRVGSQGEVIKQTDTYRRTLIEGGLIDEHSMPRHASRATLVDVPSPYRK